MRGAAGNDETPFIGTEKTPTRSVLNWHWNWIDYGICLLPSTQIRFWLGQPDMELKVLGKLWHLAREKDLDLGEIVMAFEIQCICSNRNNWNYTQL